MRRSSPAKFVSIWKGCHLLVLVVPAVFTIEVISTMTDQTMTITNIAHMLLSSAMIATAMMNFHHHTRHRNHLLCRSANTSPQYRLPSRRWRLPSDPTWGEAKRTADSNTWDWTLYCRQWKSKEKETRGMVTTITMVVIMAGSAGEMGATVMVANHHQLNDDLVDVFPWRISSRRMPRPPKIPPRVYCTRRRCMTRL